MDYKEFKELYNENAFSEFRSVELLKLGGIIPDKFHDIIPDKCSCGSDFILSNTMGTMRCCNHRCSIKMTYQLSRMFKSFNCDGVGPETCRQMVDFFMSNGKFEIPSHVEVLSIPYSEFPLHLLGSRWQDVWIALEKIKKSQLTFGKLISKISIPTFGSESEKIFEDVVDFEALAVIIRSEGLYNFFKKKGVHDIKKVEIFRIHLKDVYYAQTALRSKMVRKGYRIIEVCITGRLAPGGVSMTKDEFVSLCNQEGQIEGIPVIQVRQSKARKTVDYVVADTVSNSRSFIEGAERGVVVTSTLLLASIRKEIDKWKDTMN